MKSPGGEDASGKENLHSRMLSVRARPSKLWCQFLAVVHSCRAVAVPLTGDTAPAIPDELYDASPARLAAAHAFRAEVNPYFCRKHPASRF